MTYKYAEVIMPSGDKIQFVEMSRQEFAWIWENNDYVLQPPFAAKRQKGFILRKDALEAARCAIRTWHEERVSSSIDTEKHRKALCKDLGNHEWRAFDVAVALIAAKNKRKPGEAAYVAS